MKICQPVEIEQGVDNVLHGHFRSAPRFIVYDMETNESQTVSNQFKKDDHSIIKPINSLKDQYADVAIVGGINRCHLKKLHRNGFRVFQAKGLTLEQNVEAFRKGELRELTLHNTRRGFIC